MIVIGVDVHKHSLTAVAVDELGRPLTDHAGAVDERIVAWARSLEGERLWALEDCRHVTRGLERALLELGERLVRVPPRLTAPQRRRNRTRGKSDRIDEEARTVARSPDAGALNDNVMRRRFRYTRTPTELRWRCRQVPTARGTAGFKVIADDSLRPIVLDSRTGRFGQDLVERPGRPAMGPNMASHIATSALP
jgi:transposase